MRSLSDYTVGWISALPLEMAAAMAALDEDHGRPNQQPANDNNNYVLGRIDHHNVVIACLPSGVYGTTSATAVAINMTTTFPRLRFGLMVGIGGGVPSTERDIRLGDVVVGRPQGRVGGVIQYDLGKTISDGHQTLSGSLNKSDPVLLTAVSSLNALHMKGGNRIPQILAEMAARQPRMEASFSSPGAEHDDLYAADYVHSGGNTCEHCDKQRLIQRPKREDHSPAVFYGIIASGNQVIKDAATRDRLGRELGAICFEMEAAGLMDHFPCLVVRGICDYSDSHKNKGWQNFAAATAAAYAKELLSVLPSGDIGVIPHPPPSNRGQPARPSFLATRDWYERENVSLASLVPTIQYPDQDFLVAVSVKEEDVSIHIDRALSEYFPVRSETMNTGLKNALRRVFLQSSGQFTTNHWYVQASESRTYMLRQPRAIFKSICLLPDVRSWLGELFLDGQQAYFIIGYRTALNARLVWEAARENSVLADANHSRSVLGERIYAVCYRKVSFRFLRGPETAFLTASNRWNLFTDARGSGGNNGFIEVDISDEDVAVNDANDSWTVGEGA
ncbi:hypothetical protein BHE90_003220 [Fusarium euwallaceae]|uniref:Nucleoside phosphorylase domain-containing protein n=1 Tax=Fusarium euwallaceae TaxID=1147111 RepID=A0A430M2W9_9HYPO|nr:hypothetical protein BHE90_003220 [Fusarium euwallaceae]